VYGFALRPRWVLSHVFVVALVGAMIWAGFWQLQRLDERKSANERVVGRTELDIEPIDDVVNGITLDSGDDVEFRRAAATGTYLTGDQVVVVNRSLDGAAGAWVLTPLMLDDGTALVVNRGWIPFSLQQTDDRSSVDPPAGRVEVEGLVMATQSRSGLGAGDPDVADQLARVDLAGYGELVDYGLRPVYLQLESQLPASGPGLPARIPRPGLSNGPHLSYAVQWFIFATIGIIGYPLILRRAARASAGTRSLPADESDLDAA